jgi:chromosome partitioning protein
MPMSRTAKPPSRRYDETASSIKLTTIQLQGAAIQQQVRQLASKYDDLVIDVGGRDTGSLRAALAVADTILVPFQPRSPDFLLGVQIGALILEARSVNEGLKAFALLNVADSQGQDNDNAIATLPPIEGVVPLPLLVTRRPLIYHH